MRSILAGLALVLLPSLANAECLCTCVRGQATAICRPQALVEPICQQICVEKIEQSLGPIGGGGGGGLGASSIGSTIGLNAGTTVGTGIGDVIPGGEIGALSRSGGSFDRTTNGQAGR